MYVCCQTTINNSKNTMKHLKKPTKTNLACKPFKTTSWNLKLYRFQKTTNHKQKTLRKEFFSSMKINIKPWQVQWQSIIVGNRQTICTVVLKGRALKEWKKGMLTVVIYFLLRLHSFTFQFNVVMPFNFAAHWNLQIQDNSFGYMVKCGL